MLITAYDYHVFKSAAFSDTDMSRFLGAIHRPMKKDGVVIVVDHLAKAGMALRDSVLLQRMDPDVVQSEMSQAGFVLDTDSLMLRRDDAHTQLAEVVFLTRAPKPADAFVLKFRKPKDALNTDLRPRHPLQFMRGFFGNTIEVSGGDHSLHFLHANGTYQEMRNGPFDSGLWFFERRRVDLPLSARPQFFRLCHHPARVR